ncbi:hypothetical protein [Pseudoclavibacter sp. RFBB5]|uniref:hypothetical protein n=1 Tax=Pseudoclavibacter sp. RFBB5 TaxID=2080574 RepID=UPI000CE7DCDD|nr:hypothetical protein [Pseudoclavibacter sp. RFBB5]PPG29633.1 hypothetical protein C5B97_11720 [Pseudoclavibacter sp. RFBB5]
MSITFTAASFVGTAPDWVAAIGTVLAAVGAVIIFGIGVGLRAKSQAARVYATLDRRFFFDPTRELDMQLKFRDDLTGVGVEVSQFNPQQLDLIMRPTTQALILTCTIHNGSDEIMGPARVDVYSPVQDAFIATLQPEVILMPGESQTISCAIPSLDRPFREVLRLRVVYRDSSNRWWQRFEKESARRAGVQILASTGDDEQLARRLSTLRPPKL